MVVDHLWCSPLWLQISLGAVLARRWASEEDPLHSAHSGNRGGIYHGSCRESLARCLERIGRSQCPFTRFWGRAHPTKTDYRKKLVPLFYPPYWRTQLVLFAPLGPPDSLGFGGFDLANGTTKELPPVVCFDELEGAPSFPNPQRVVPPFLGTGQVGASVAPSASMPPRRVVRELLPMHDMPGGQDGYAGHLLPPCVSYAWFDLLLGVGGSQRRPLCVLCRFISSRPGEGTALQRHARPFSVPREGFGLRTIKQETSSPMARKWMQAPCANVPQMVKKTHRWSKECTYRLIFKGAAGLALLRSAWRAHSRQEFPFFSHLSSYFLFRWFSTSRLGPSIKYLNEVSSGVVLKEVQGGNRGVISGWHRVAATWLRPLGQQRRPRWQVRGALHSFPKASTPQMRFATL